HCAGGGDADQVEHRGQNVVDVVKLGAQLPLGGQAPGPVDHHGHPVAPFEGALLVVLEGGVAGRRPAHRVVGIGVRAAPDVQERQVIFPGAAAHQDFVDRPGKATFGAGAIVGGDQDNSVV